MLRAPILLVASLIAVTAVAAERPRPDSAAWNADIDYLATELPKRHPNPFHDITPAQFNAALAELKTRTASMSLVQFSIELQKIVASLRDAHTEVDTRVTQTFYPLRVYRFSDGFYVTKTNAQSSAGCGARLLSINGVPVEDVYERVKSVISSENEAWFLARAPVFMMRAEVLQAVGVIDRAGAVPFDFQTEFGATFELTLHPVSGQSAFNIFDAPYVGQDLPLYLQKASRNYWYEWDEAHQLLYLKFNVCADDPSEPLANVMMEMQAIAGQNHVATFVVDLRNNSGGSDAVLRPLIEGVRNAPELRGHLYAIIGRETFSSAMLNAVQLRDAGAILAGEDTGGRPNAYGEVKSMMLPASGLMVYYATKYFHASDIDTPSVEPSVRVVLDSDDFFMRRDPVLQSILGRAAAAGEAASAGGRRRAARPAVMRTCPQ